MARTIRQYCNSNPAPVHHQKAGEKVACSAPPLSAGWAWNPDEETRKAIARGNRLFRKAKKAKDEAKLEEAKMATNKTSKKKVSKKVAKKKVVKKVVKKTTGNTVSLKAICTELKVDPKVARRKLRAAGLKGHDAKSRWEFTQAQAKKARELLAA
jgi:hypothetical protein